MGSNNKRQTGQQRQYRGRIKGRRCSDDCRICLAVFNRIDFGILIKRAKLWLYGIDKRMVKMGAEMKITKEHMVFVIMVIAILACGYMIAQ